VALIFDTGPLVAIADRRDRLHERCRRIVDEMDELFVVPAPVLPEFDYLTSQLLGPGPMVAMLRDIEAGSVVVEELVAEDYPRVRELIDRYEDVGFVDASVLAIVERFGERKLATLDHRHFAAMRPRHVDALELVPAS
jgi:uncharacterized protein